MFKLICLAALLIVTANGLFLPIQVPVPTQVGGYIEQNSNTPIIKELTNWVAEMLYSTQHLILTNLETIRVQVQIVSGTNYKIDFSATPISGGVQGETITCQVIVYIKFNGERSLVQHECKP